MWKASTSTFDSGLPPAWDERVELRITVREIPELRLTRVVFFSGCDDEEAPARAHGAMDWIQRRN